MMANLLVLLIMAKSRLSPELGERARERERERASACVCDGALTLSKWNVLKDWKFS